MFQTQLLETPSILQPTLSLFLSLAFLVIPLSSIFFSPHK